MKNALLSLFALALTLGLSAQKFSTKTGEVSFFSDAALEDIEAVNHQALAALDLDKGNIAFVLQIRSFEFEKALMQEHFNENYMHSDKFPKSTFEGSVLNPEVARKDGTHEIKLKGKLTIHGETKEIAVPATLVRKGNELTIQCRFTIKLGEFGIKNDKVENIAEAIEIRVNTTLKS